MAGGRGRWLGPALRLAPALAGLGALLVSAVWTSDRATAPATAWLGLTAAAVFAPLLLVVRRERLPLALLSLLAPFAALYLLPRRGPVPLALFALLLVAAVALVALERIAEERPAPALTWLALALAAGAATNFGRLWSEPFDSALLLRLVAAPVVAALLLSAFDRGAGDGAERRPAGDAAAGDRAGLGGGSGRAAPVVAAALVASGPAFAPLGLAALAAAALVARFRPSAASLGPLLVALPAFGHEPLWAALSLCGLVAGATLGVRVVAAAARGALALLAFGTLLVSAPPWLRSQPVATLLGAVTRPPARLVDEPLAHKGVPLSAESPIRGWALSGAPAGALVVESSLADSTRLDCGRVVGTVRLLAPGRSWVVGDLTVGPGTGEWASARPDVAPTLACGGLKPFVHWLPDAGRFFGRTFRARMAVDPPFPAERVEIERASDLPPEVRLYVQRVATER